MAPKAEYAPGIPSKDIQHPLPITNHLPIWEYTLHEHDAEKRGKHYDLRLGDPDTGHAHSWALEAKLPLPGQATWAISQPTHTLKYMDFEGSIPSGVYGAGKVSLADRTKTEIINSRPGHITFGIYRGSGPEEFTLHQIKDNYWKLYNRTFHRGELPLISTERPDYHSILVDKVDTENINQLMTAKVDDAHNLFIFKPGERIRVVSYRPTKRSAGVIEHTHKVPDLHNVPSPKELGDTVIRGGLYAIHPETGKAIPATTLAGLLNSNVWKSRKGQEEYGPLRTVIYDVERYKGKDVSKIPYGDKWKILEEVSKAVPGIELPRSARTPEEKKKLLADLKIDKIPETKEGVVLQDLHHFAFPIKAKFTDEHDVHIRDFFAGEGKYRDKGVGGFTYSHTPNGPIAGRVGTGLSDIQRRDMYAHPDHYVGMVAKVHAQDKYPSGALRAPAFLGFHLDKNPQDRLDEVKHS